MAAVFVFIATTGKENTYSMNTKKMRKSHKKVLTGLPSLKRNNTL